MGRQAGRHGVDPHPRGRRLQGRAAGQGHDARLCRGVVGLSHLGPPADHRGVVDDGARPSRHHVAQPGARATKGPVQRDVQHRPPLLVGHVHDLGRSPEAGVVHQHVEMAGGADGRLEQSLHLGLVRHVARHRGWPGAHDRLELLGRLVQAPLVAVAEDHEGALLGAPPRRGQPDARPGCGGHQHRPTLEQLVTLGIGRHPRQPGRAHQRSSTRGSGGNPSTRSPMMLRWIWFEPP